MARILIVDDEASIRRALEKYLAELGYEVFAAGDGLEALKILEVEAVDLALVDLVMPKLDGVSFIRKMKRIAPDVIAIVLTGFGTITSAVEVMKAGAYHYLTKPFDLEDIGTLLKTALGDKRFRKGHQAMSQGDQENFQFENIIGKSEEMQRVFQLIEKVAQTDSNVLILGESGTGKELIAKAIHTNSLRKEHPLVTVNCAAIPEELLETELFGHMKGSFTGAHVTKEGRFSVANGGTIFLDEIGDMSLKLQVKLLRVLQDKKFEPVGATTTEEVDVRIIAATNHNLELQVKKGAFREDLFYRLNVIPIALPPLRERFRDIPELIKHFVKKYQKENNKILSGISEKAKQVLMHYPWPGNVRELENTIERLVILKTKGPIDVADLPEKIQGGLSMPIKDSPFEMPETGLSFKHAISIFENELILKALEKTDWNKNRAAHLLRINRTTLVEKIKKKGLDKGVGKQGS